VEGLFLGKLQKNSTTLLVTCLMVLCLGGLCKKGMGGARDPFFKGWGVVRGKNWPRGAFYAPRRISGLVGAKKNSRTASGFSKLKVGPTEKRRRNIKETQLKKKNDHSRAAYLRSTSGKSGQRGVVSAPESAGGSKNPNIRKSLRSNKVAEKLRESSTENDEKKKKKKKKKKMIECKKGMCGWFCMQKCAKGFCVGGGGLKQSWEK